MSGTQKTGPTSSDLEEGARAQRRWLPLALIGAAVLVVLIVVIAWTTSSASPGGADASGATAPTASPAGVTASPSDVPTADPAGSTGSVPSADVASDVRASSDPHPFDAPAEIAPGVSATVSAITSVDGVAKGVGETAGPAIRFEVTITNDSTDTIDLSLTTVLVDYRADLVPAIQMSGNADQEPLPASLGAGKSATASYVFTVPAEDRDSVRIMVDYLADVPLAIFTGPVPAA